MDQAGKITFGYNFNYANFANVGITRTWGVLKNDYDVKTALNNSDENPEKKHSIRKQKLWINILSNLSQYVAINAVMLKLDKQVNKSTLVAVAIPFLINLLIDITARTKQGAKLADKLSLNTDPSDITEFTKPESPETKALKTKYDPVLADFIAKNGNISFGVSYTNVHILGKLVNKIRASAAQTYDVYSAGTSIDLPKNELKQSTGLKFLQEISSQLLENIIYFGVLLKFKKQIDKSFKLAVFLPAAMTICFDLISRSSAFGFLNDWSKKLFTDKNLSMLEIKLKHPDQSINSIQDYKNYLRKKYVNAV